MKQLTLEDVVGSFDYTATSTADKFLKRNSIMTYSVEFYDKDEKWKPVGLMRSPRAQL